MVFGLPTSPVALQNMHLHTWTLFLHITKIPWYQTWWSNWLHGFGICRHTKQTNHWGLNSCLVLMVLPMKQRAMASSRSDSESQQPSVLQHTSKAVKIRNNSLSLSIFTIVSWSSQISQFHVHVHKCANRVPGGTPFTLHLLWKIDHHKDTNWISNLPRSQRPLKDSSIL